VLITNRIPDLETWESPQKEDNVLEMLGRLQITAEKETLSCSCLKPRCFLRGSCVAMDMDMLRWGWALLRSKTCFQSNSCKLLSWWQTSVRRAVYSGPAVSCRLPCQWSEWL